MNQDRHYPNCTTAHGPTDVRRTDPSWLVFAEVRPWILPVVDQRVDFVGIDEPKSTRPGPEPYVWMRPIGAASMSRNSPVLRMYAGTQ
jgi:hypothetical protein